MSHKFKLLALVSVIALVSGCATAPSSLPAVASIASIGGTGSAAPAGAAASPGSAASTGNEGAQQDSLVRAYVAANKEVLLAQSKMAEAVGLKESAAKLKSTASALGDGATRGNLADADKIQSDASKEMSARLNDRNLKMDAKSKALYSSGMGSLGVGIVRYVALRPQVANFINMTKAQPLLAATKLNAGAYVVTNFPGNAKNVYDTLAFSTAYAKNHDIPVPADATKALSNF